MYEELVERLREESEIERWLQPHSANETPKLLDDAADAIEELSSAGSIYGKAWTLGYDAGRDENSPRWISVTERLPEDGSLVGKLIADSDGNIRIASQCAKITLSGGKTVYTDLIDLVSLLAEDTPTTEWEDCTHITHWMPLPSTEGLNEA